jgi:hypothetical protein
VRRLLLGTGFGALAGFAAGAIAQGLYSEIGPTEVLRVICWGIAGGLLGFSLSFRIPNLTRRRGFGGGFAGGFLGGIVFIGIGAVGSPGFGRLLGIAAIGFAIGLMIVFADAVFREAWLEVRYGPHEARTVTLGPEPVQVGSDVSSEVYLPNVAGVACIYRFVGGQILCDDRLNRRSGPVASGLATVIGHVTVTPWAAEARDPQPMLEMSVFQRPYQESHTRDRVLDLSDGSQLVLTQGARLSIKDIRGLEPASKDSLVADVSPHPTDPSVFGLKNLSRQTWRATLVSGRQVQIDPGRSIRVEPGVRIHFGAADGTIR